MSNDGAERIADIVDGATPAAAPADWDADDDMGLPAETLIGAPPPPGQASSVIAECAELDHSDTDNGLRLRKHFGDDIAVLETEGGDRHEWVVWDGRVWDAANGNNSAHRVAQNLGDRIILEAARLDYSKPERAAIDAAAAFDGMASKDLSEAEKIIKSEASEARAALKARKNSRRKFGVTSKNNGRIQAMLTCAGAHLLRKPESFDADPLVVATQTHTLRFDVTQAPAADSADPARPRLVTRAALIASPGHARADNVTKLVPSDYDPGAKCPLWDAFLAEFLPVDSVRDFVRVYCGLGLTGLPIQKVLFHYGLGANGKSVFLEVLSRALGALAIGLPAETLIGDQQRQGQNASPDLARLRGARFVRVLELPEGEPVREALLKKLMGGEKITVRNLFKGFFDFQPVFKAHMSGNGYPRIDGADNGIWRRIAVIHWPVTLEESRQENFEDVVRRFEPERAGILNWLISGALEYLEAGLHAPAEVVTATDEYKAEMNPVGQFIADCLYINMPRDPARPETPAQTVRANSAWDAYKAWCLANAQRPYGEKNFAKAMKSNGVEKKRSGAGILYTDCQLHDVPRGDAIPPPGDDGYDR